MRKLDLAEVKNMSDKALLEKATHLKQEIADLIVDKNLGKLGNLKSIKNKRRDLAQILTVKRQKELVSELESFETEVMVAEEKGKKTKKSK